MGGAYWVSSQLLVSLYQHTIRSSVKKGIILRGHVCSGILKLNGVQLLLRFGDGVAASLWR